MSENRLTDLSQLRNILMVHRLAQLSAACAFYNLRRSGAKPEVVERLLTFLLSASTEERNQLPIALNSERDIRGAKPPPLSPGMNPSASQSAYTPSHPSPTRGQQSPGRLMQPAKDIETQFSSIDPFHPIAPVSHPFLYYAVCRSGATSFSLDIADLKGLRRQGYAVWLRCVSKVARKNERHVWPRELRVFVNLSQVARVEEPKKLKKRRDEPVELTAFLKGGKNQIQLSIADSNPGNFTVALIVCGSLTSNAIVNSVPLQSVERCKDRLRDVISKLKSDVLVDDRADGFHSLDLRCPITLDKLGLPARGTCCTHARCFDLKAFVAVNKQTSNLNLRWNCPVCQKLLLPKDLIVDTFVKEIVDSSRQEDLEVLLNEATCEWKAVDVTASTEPNSSHHSDDEDQLYRTEGPLTAKDEVDLVDLGESSDEDYVPAPKFPRWDSEATPRKLSEPAPVKPQVEVIELD